MHTWTSDRFGNDNVALHLDRYICNDDWVDFWNYTTWSSLIRHQSDHILCSCLGIFFIPCVTPFKFYKSWTSHDDFRRLVTYV